MRHSQDESPVSFKVSVARLPRKGMPVVIDADPGQRTALAAAHGLRSIESFHVELQVSPWKRNGIKVAGHVRADITQECVVTLEPVSSVVLEEVDGLFLPLDSKLGRSGFGEGGEIHLDVDGPDAPETFSGDSIDVGAFAEEFFALGVDPYPRKPGIEHATDQERPETDNADGPLQAKLRQFIRNG